MELYLLTHFVTIAILFCLHLGYVISNPLPNNTEVSQSIITPAPNPDYAVLFKRDTNTCGYITGNPSLPNTCASPFACQWYTSAAGYPGQKFCTTDGYIVTANYGPVCLDYGNTACLDPTPCYSKYGSWQNCENLEYPYCVTVQYASGPGAVVEYTSYYCSSNTVSRTVAVYFEATTPISPTTKTITISTGPSTTPTVTLTPTPSPTSTQSQTPVSTSTSPPLPTNSSSGGLDTGSIVGIVFGVLSVCIAIAGIFAGAFVPQFQYWVGYSVPNALFFQHRQPPPGSALGRFVQGNQEVSEIYNVR